MADVTILACPCGMRLKATGAIPGRLGKCPACGGLLRVPDHGAATAPPPRADPDTTASASGRPAVSPARPSTFTAQRVRSSRERSSDGTRGSRWNWIRVPLQPETRLRGSLLYPLRGETGIALLMLMPPVFWLATIPLLTIVSAWASGNLGSGLVGFVALLPSLLILLPVGSFTLLYLGQVIATSAVGEVHLPRWPDWDPTEMLRGIARWIWAILVGGILGGFPSVAYWLYCGDIDLFDAVILLELAAMGTAYAQVALLASILYDDPLGAHPLTVVRALRRVGWAWLYPSLVIAAFVLLAWVALSVVLEVESPLLSALAYWAYWVFLFYGLMVILRVLGLFYYRHARVLGWFHERPRWGG